MRLGKFRHQKQNLHGTDNTKDTHEMQYNARNHQYPKIKNEPESLIKKEFLENSKQTSDENEEKFEDIADKVFEEAQELLVNSPWILTFGTINICTKHNNIQIQL